MPELPEVTVIVNQLDKKLKGLVIKSIEYDWPKKFLWGHRPGGSSGPEGKFSIKDIKGAKVEKVERMGKVVVMRLVGGSVGKWDSRKAQKEPTNQSTYKPTDLSILIHLKLTGQLIFVGKNSRVGGGHPLPPLNKPVPNTTTRATFTFTNREKLYFNDMRKFGWVKIVESEKLKDESYIKKLGPDPLKMKFEEFRERLKTKRQGRIKKTLMDQSVISGVGNIYSDEGLWRAKVNPRRSIESLTESELKAIYKGVRESFRIAIEKGGSSDSAYIDSGGEKGLYLSFGKAYHMTGKPCARCKTPIVREKMDGRSAHYCPNCQKLK